MLLRHTKSLAFSKKTSRESRRWGKKGERSMLAREATTDIHPGNTAQTEYGRRPKEGSREKKSGISSRAVRNERTTTKLP